ncbi:MAG: tRNA (cmo5U34)-methyltransferase [Granulosicoccus sp.]|jgi:tRNA (cmo5U34)-methyltransferase
MDNKDSLFSHPLGDIEGFRFNQSVVDVFPDMLRRSVPGYESIITQSALLAARYVQPGTRLYDLGSSLGATSIAMRNALAHTNRGSVADCEIHAIDNAPAMIDASRTLIALGEESLPADRRVPIHLHEADLEAHPLDQASVVAMNFTLQFVKPASRADLMQKIAHALQPGGVLILSEKVRFEDPIVNEMHIDMYHAFKSQNGYSDLEISQKRTALENVLVPDTLDEHRNRLMDAGFSHCTVWFQCFNFASLIAIK